MPTKPLPDGTCNWTLNVPVDLRADADRLAFMAGESRNRFWRDVIVERIREARMSGLLDAAGQMFFRLGCVIVIFMAVGGENELRRRVRRRRDDTVAELQINDEEAEC